MPKVNKKHKGDKVLKGFAIKVFGCQMNENDSEKLKGILEELKYEGANYIIHKPLDLLNVLKELK